MGRCSRWPGCVSGGVFRCRLSADRALESVEQAEAFLRDRGLLTRTADCALPSLYAACHEDPYQPGSPGFATCPATKWPWSGEPAGRGHLIAAAARAAVLAPETELRRWFSRPRYWSGSLVDDLIGQGRLRRIDGHLTVAGHSRRPGEAPRPAASRNPARSHQQ